MNKILVVDDDVDILTLVKMTLRLYNYHVEGVSRWQDVNDSIANFSPDLILLDVSLAGADGRDICRNLKAVKETQHIPIVLFSANAEMGKSIKDCNAQAFIAKPYNLADLLETIRSLLDTSQQNKVSL